MCGPFTSIISEENAYWLALHSVWWRYFLSSFLVCLGLWYIDKVPNPSKPINQIRYTMDNKEKYFWGHFKILWPDCIYCMLKGINSNSNLKDFPVRQMAPKDIIIPVEMLSQVYLLRFSGLLKSWPLWVQVLLELALYIAIVLVVHPEYKSYWIVEFSTGIPTES